MRSHSNRTAEPGGTAGWLRSTTGPVRASYPEAWRAEGVANYIAARMAEVPDYLLQRSRERRAALGLQPSGGGEAGAPAAAPAEGGEPASAPAEAGGGVPAPVEAPVPAAA